MLAVNFAACDYLWKFKGERFLYCLMSALCFNALFFYIYIYFGSLSSLLMMMSSSTNETRNSLQICNECGEQIELLIVRT